MEVDGQGVSLTGDHSLESAAEVMSVLQLDQRLPNGREDYMKVLRDLGFESNEDGSEQHTQFVFQGQCLILGDANVGKTSLTKSLMGKPFDTKEPGTKDVEISLVDREWNDLDGYNGLTFGNFRRFASSVLTRVACYGPGDLRFEFALNRTKICRIITTSKLFLQLSWVILVILCFASNPTSVPVWFFLFSLAAFLGAHLSEQLNFKVEYRTVSFNLYKILMLIQTTPYFFTGLGTVHILTKNCKDLFDCLKEFYTESGSLHIWDCHFFLFTVLVAKISVDLILWTMGNFLLLSIFKDRGPEESLPLLPGQTKLVVNSAPTLLHIIICLIPVHCGIICAYVVAMSTEKSILEQSPLAFFTQIVFMHQMIHIVISCAHDFRVGGKIKRGVYLVSIIILLSCHENLGWGTFLLLWFYNLFKDREISSPGFVKILMNGVTIIWIERVLMNFTKLKSALDKAFSSLKLKLVDFPGDDEYCAHHIFMRHEAMYVVVFNMANFVNGNFRNMTGKIQRIRFWLESICSKSSPKSQIILVGTHRGNVDQCLKSIDTHLRKYLWHDFSDELVLNKEEKFVYFGIENSLGRDDNGIKNLQREIMLAAEKQKATMGRKIPYSWIKVQDAIINFRKNKKAKFCVTKHMFPVSVGNFICSNWSQDTLRYLHEKGLIIYIDQKEDSKLFNWILLKPELLIDIIKALVTSQTTQQDGLRRDRTLLHEKGMLTNRLLEKTVLRFTSNEDEMALTSFLEEYGIICPLFYNYTSMSKEAQVTHFVPSLLPLSSDEDPQVWLPGPDDKKFYVFFHRFLPEPLFHKLLSRAHKLSKAQFPKGHPLVCRNVGRFWLEPNQPYRLLLLKNEEMIEVTCNSSEGMEPTDLLCLVFSMVDEICRSSFPFAKFHCGPACPSTKCPGIQGDYLSHPGVQSSRSKRCHVFNILPARQNERTCADSFYCVNKNFRQQLKEWEV